ncbi:MAG: hypothetical protein LAP38_19045 [Acidobacteriia bacterium]|nr:hypothetical protein [Terriglobia bacterium]
MNRTYVIIALLAILSFSAAAAVPACSSSSPGWTFAALGYCGDLSTGVTFTAANGQQITIFPELLKDGNVQANTTNNGNTGVNPDHGNYIDGMFEVQDNHNGNIASGIAPYYGTNPTGDSPYTGQQGITDFDSGGHHYDVMLYIEIQGGTGAGQVPTGTTLSFLMQQGDQAIDVVDAYWDAFGSGQTAPPNLSAFTHSATDVSVGLANGDNTVPQFSLKTSTDSTHPVEWIAIKDDCTYLLLNSITETSSVPEPRFYGLMLAGLLGIAGIYARKRRTAQQPS